MVRHRRRRADRQPRRQRGHRRRAGLVLYPGSKVATWIFPNFIFCIPAWIYLGLWFLYQFVEAGFGLFKAPANGGVAFFAHVGGLIFGGLVTGLLARAGRVAPTERWLSGT